MSSMVKINQLEIENVKRIKAIQLQPDQNGLTIIGGRNNQGKSSVLDAIAWALGGEKYRPSQAQREGSVLPPHLKITLSNGLIVERAGKNSVLKVIDPNGKKAGQQILNEFVEQLALDLPKFMNATEKEKAEILLKVIGVGDQLMALDRKASELYNKRHAIGQIADQKQKFAQEMPHFPDLPDELVSASDLIQQQQAILARNGENQRKRDRLKEITFEKHRIHDEISRLEDQMKELQKRIEERKSAHKQVSQDEEFAMKSAAELQDESTAELEANIQSIEVMNSKIRTNLDREKAFEDAKIYQEQYRALSSELSAVRMERQKLLESAVLPLPGLSVTDGRLTYNGMNWDSLSGSDQLKVATAIVWAVNPNCGFVLLDKLEQMDLETLAQFGAWLESEGLQVIATRVSTGEECSIIIEDGTAVQPCENTVPTWNGGTQ